MNINVDLAMRLDALEKIIFSLFPEQKQKLEDDFKKSQDEYHGRDSKKEDKK